MMPGFVIVFITALCRLGYLWAAVRFCRRYLEISRVRERIWIAFLLGGGVLGSALYENFAALPNILFTLGQHVALIGSVLLLFRGRTERKLMTSAILTAVTTLTGSFVTSLTACLLLVWKHTWYHMPVPVIDMSEEYLIICCVQSAKMLTVWWLSRRQISFLVQESPPLIRVREVTDPGWKKGHALLAIPLFAVTLLIDVANWGASYGVMVRSGGNMGLYYDQIFSHTEFLILTALSMCAVGFYLFGLDRICLEQTKSAQYHAQIAAYRMLEEQYGQAERLRHDMKNHVLALTGLLRNREWEKMSEYLDSMRDGGGFGAAEEATGNSAVDALLYQKRQRAENRRIRWLCDVQIPKTCCIQAFDLCVLFGNILDNALEACERMERGGGVCYDEHEGAAVSEQFIDVQARAVKSCFLLEVRNSVSPVEECGNGRKSRPGIGLMNVRDVVRRYDGVMNTKLEDGVFTISVLVPHMTSN